MNNIWWTFLFTGNQEQFLKYNYNSLTNRKLYGFSEPLKYNLNSSTAPISLFYGKEDLLATPGVNILHWIWFFFNETECKKPGAGRCSPMDLERSLHYRREEEIDQSNGLWMKLHLMEKQSGPTFNLNEFYNLWFGYRFI